MARNSDEEAACDSRSTHDRLDVLEITEADVPELTDVMTRAFDDDARKHLGQAKGGPPGYDDGEFFRKWLFGFDVTRGYKAVSDGRAVGGIIVWILPDDRNILGTIFVDPDCQDRGVGAALWEHVEALYPDTTGWRLETPGFALKNHGFYEKCGFRRVEVKPPQDGIPFESWVYQKDRDG